jgi:hypothetical protein
MQRGARWLRQRRDWKRDPAVDDLTSPPLFFFAIGGVMAFVGFSLIFFDRPTDSVRGIPNPIYGWIWIAAGIFAIAGGFEAQYRRRSARRKKLTPENAAPTSLTSDTDQIDHAPWVGTTEGVPGPTATVDRTRRPPDS